MPSSPKKEKSTGKTRGRVPSRQSAGTRPSRTPRKTAQHKTEGILSQIHKPRFLPFLTIWLLAVAVLAGLVYWGESSKPLKVAKARRKNPPAYAPSTSATSQQRKPIATRDSSPAPRPTTVTPSPSVGTDKTPEPQKPSIANELPAGKSDEKVSVALSSQANGSTHVLPPTPQPPSPALPPFPARVAIVIDDFGLDLEVAQRFLSLPYPITFSILPYLRHSREVAELAHSRNHEVILHLPMEPQGFPKVDPGPGALLLSMSETQIEKAIETALDSCPHLAGINNHMGSRFTENAAQMQIVLKELNRRGLYFLDSETSPKSVGFPLAQEMSVPSVRRDIFLDHTDSEEVIKSQLLQLIRKAKIQGSAVAIGHPHESTWKVLSRSADLFQREGVTVVPASQLILPGKNGAK